MNPSYECSIGNWPVIEGDITCQLIWHIICYLQKYYFSHFLWWLDLFNKTALVYNLNTIYAFYMSILKT